MADQASWAGAVGVAEDAFTRLRVTNTTRLERENAPNLPKGNTDGSKAVSPLRYPGSKRQLLGFIRKTLKQLGPADRFVEPFAGGASVSLQLAAEGSVARTTLAEFDDLLYSFWQVAAFDTQWLIDALWDIEVNIDSWHKLKAWEPTQTRDKALQCLFLNRTSFSGILHAQAGPIGGLTQTSQYAIDCRFSRETLHHRILRIGELAQSGRIEDVWHLDWKATIDRARKRSPRNDPTLYYLDPPFYAKAKKLYRHSFEAKDHIRLANFLRRFSRPWILSYDDHSEVRQLYGNHKQAGLSLFSAEYRAAASSRKADELIVTNVEHVAGPQGTRRR